MRITDFYIGQKASITDMMHNAEQPAAEQPAAQPAQPKPAAVPKDDDWDLPAEFNSKSAFVPIEADME